MMLGFEKKMTGAIQIIAENTSSKNYFEKLNEMIRSDKEKVNLKYRELKIKVKRGK